VRQFKEAFAMIDQDSDGLIDANDLRAMLTSMGKAPSATQIDHLLADASTHNGRKGINFTQFLTSM
jgi:myosin regulatory light chain 12